MAMIPSPFDLTGEVLGEALGGAGATERLLGIPFARAVGMTASVCSRDAARSHVPFRQGYAHTTGDDDFCEGIIAAIADQAGSVAVWGRYGLSLPHATVSLCLTFLTRTRGSALAFEAEMLSTEDGLGQTGVRVFQPDGREVARGSVDFALGTYPGDSGPSTTQPVPDPALLDGAPIVPVDGSDVGAMLGLEAQGDGDLVLPFRANLVGSRDPQALHGGAIAAAGVASARAALGDAANLRIMQLSVDYLRSGLPETAVLRARVISRTRRTALVETDVLQAEGTRLVARVRARFHAG